MGTAGPGDRLRQARIHAGYESAAEAARVLDIPEATYSGHENGSRGFYKHLTRYADFFSVNIDWLWNGRGSMTKKGAFTSGSAAENIQHGNVQIRITGRVAAGVFVEAHSLGDVSVEHFPVSPWPPMPGYDVEDQFDLIVQGTSINKFAADGAVLRCVRDADWQPGDMVIVERSRFDGQLVETTAKRVKVREGGGFELWPESDDPRWQTPIILDGGDEGETIRIIARVLCEYKWARPLI